MCRRHYMYQLLNIDRMCSHVRRSSVVTVTRIRFYSSTSRGTDVVPNSLIAAFHALNEKRSVDGIMQHWSPNGVYDNPMLREQPVMGHHEIRRCMEELLKGLEKNDSKLSIDRVTEGESHCVVEWKVVPYDGR
eukprot:21623_1